MKAALKSLVVAVAMGAATFVFSSSAMAEGSDNKYEAVLTGMVCAACKAHVTHAVETLPNTSEIKITRGEKEGTQLVSFVSKDGTLRSDQLVQALGEEGKRYQVLSLEKK